MADNQELEIFSRTMDRLPVIGTSTSVLERSGCGTETDGIVYLISVSIYELMNPVADGQRMAPKLGKKIEFELEGGKILVDRLA